MGNVLKHHREAKRQREQEGDQRELQSVMENVLEHHREAKLKSKQGMVSSLFLGLDPSSFDPSNLYDEIKELGNKIASLESTITSITDHLKDVLNAIATSAPRSQSWARWRRSPRRSPSWATVAESVMSAIQTLSDVNICGALNPVENFINDEILSHAAVDIGPTCNPESKSLYGVPIAINAMRS